MPIIRNLALAFQGIVSKYQNKTALYYPHSKVKTSYSELAGLADRIAQQLVWRGCKCGDIVAIFHDKSPAAFALMLACTRLGILYTNLDPESPWERVQKILTNCQPRLIISFFENLSHVANMRTSFEVIELTEFLNESDSCNIEVPNLDDIPGSSPSYIMFTSGSTGLPKGAVMSHSNVLYFIAWAQNRFGVTDNDVFTNVNPMYFDNSVFDFFTAILSGATLIPIPHEHAKDPRHLINLVGEAGCTIWFSVPSLLVYLLTTRALKAESLPSLRKIIFGGEGFPKPKLKQLFDLFGHRAELENVYGPTECTCICSAHTICSEDFEEMQSLATLGNLSENFEAVILSLEGSDSDFGELVLLGPQIGLGYYNDVERTLQSFIQNPRHTKYRDIGYKTGDLVRRDSEGRLHFKGRADFQIKHMGYRIEIEEIEAALNSIFGINECAVVYEKLGNGMGQILAYISAEEPMSSEEVKSQLSEIIPTYMLPKKIIILEALPKNANGKIDRKLLLSPQD